MPVLYGDYKIKCPFYGSTRGCRIVCHNGYCMEFRTLKDMNEWIKNNCRKIEGHKCRARVMLTLEALKQLDERKKKHE